MSKFLLTPSLPKKYFDIYKYHSVKTASIIQNEKVQEQGIGTSPFIALDFDTRLLNKLPGVYIANDMDVSGS